MNLTTQTTLWQDDYKLTFYPFLFTAFSHVMKGVEGYETEGYTIMILMRMTFGEFDVSWIKSSTQSP